MVRVGAGGLEPPTSLRALALLEIVALTGGHYGATGVCAPWGNCSCQAIAPCGAPSPYPLVRPVVNG